MLVEVPPLPEPTSKDQVELNPNNICVVGAARNKDGWVSCQLSATLKRYIMDIFANESEGFHVNTWYNFIFMVDNDPNFEVAS